MTSVGRTAAVILLLAALAAAAPFAPGTRFGTVGLDSRFSSGYVYSYSRFTDYVWSDPILRAGIAVLPDLAVGAELALFNTFPESSDVFTSTPVIAFGPVATYYLMPNLDIVRPYVTAGAGATYGFVWKRLGWRARVGAGAMLVTSLPVALGLEGGWYGDWCQGPDWTWIHGYELAWRHGSSWFIGVRVMGFKR
jgi:hypothetical protein